MPATEQIQNIIREVVEQQLSPACIRDVTIEEDTDHDGDQILRVIVVFEAEGNRLDPQKVLGLARHLREPFEKLHEDRFPLFSFILPSELDGAAA